MKSLISTFLISNVLISSSQVVSIKKDPTLKTINIKCKAKDSKFSTYERIGMTQFAKNYLRICLNTEMQNAWKKKYKICLKKYNDNYCYKNTKIDEE